MKIIKLMMVIILSIMTINLIGVQRMGLCKGSTGVILPKGSATLSSRCLDEHEAAPDSETHYTKILGNSPNDIVVKIGNNPPIPLEQAILEKKISITGYTGVGGDSSSLDSVGWVIEKMRVYNLTTSSINVTVKRFTPIGVSSHAPFSYDIEQFANLSQKDLWKNQNKYKDKQTEYEKQYWIDQQESYQKNIVPVGQEQLASLSDNMVHLPGGSFQMDITFDVLSNERTGSNVDLDSFFFCKHEVTQAMWVAIMGSNPSEHQALSFNLPVEKVNWFSCVEFCNKLSLLQGLNPCYSGSGESIVCDFQANGYRLPTEAEWEYAARGGINGQGYTYSGSNDLTSISWRDGETHDIMSKNANEFGVYDMSGNVEEWCWNSIYVDIYRSNCRILRGGSFAIGSDYCKTQSYGYSKPESSYSNVGFRLCRTSK